jgi:hypothetical protein
MKKFVVMSGGFHPFHAGHASLYQQAKEAFPDAKVLVCATNVQSDRPFPFSLKKKLAQLSGVPPKDFIEVSRQFTIQDPALAQRIGNPDDAIVIYVRSEKDRNEAPQPWKLGPDGKPPIGKKGNIPTSKTYNRVYNGWNWDGKTIVSNAIGQGEVLMTPIQLANFMATVANRGYYYTPHIVKRIKGNIIDKKYRTKHTTTIDRKYFEPIITGMNAVYGPGGTASGLGVAGIEICGKTGTAENYLKVNGKRVKLQDHSIFVAFAPRDNPKIAIAVFVENGYWGKRWAGPITTLMIEKYLNKKITKVDFEKRMLTGSLKAQYDKLYPRKHQDSISLINNRIKDSLAKIKRTRDSINGVLKKEIKIDTLQNP